MEHGRQNFLSFGPTFYPFTPLTTQKILQISSFYTKCKKKMIITCCPVAEIQRIIFIFHFGLLFILLPPNDPKILKTWKKPLEISLFYTCVPNIMITLCTVPEICSMTDEQMDEWKKWHIETGAPPRILRRKVWLLNVTWNSVIRHDEIKVIQRQIWLSSVFGVLWLHCILP